MQRMKERCAIRHGNAPDALADTTGTDGIVSQPLQVKTVLSHRSARRRQYTALRTGRLYRSFACALAQCSHRQQQQPIISVIRAYD